MKYHFQNKTVSESPGIFYRFFCQRENQDRRPGTAWRKGRGQAATLLLSPREAVRVHGICHFHGALQSHGTWAAINLRLSTCAGHWPFQAGKRGVGQCPVAAPGLFTPRRGPAGQAGVGQCVAETLDPRFEGLRTGPAQPGWWSPCSPPSGHPPSVCRELSPGFRYLLI